MREKRHSTQLLGLKDTRSVFCEKLNVKKTKQGTYNNYTALSDSKILMQNLEG